MEQSIFNEIMELKRQNKLSDCVNLYKKAIDCGDNDALIFAGLAKIFYLQEKYKQAMYCHLIYFNLVLSYHGKKHIAQCKNQAFHLFMTIRNNASVRTLMEANGVFNDRKIFELCNCEFDYRAAIRGQDISDEYERLALYFLNEETLALQFTMGYVLSRINDNLNLPISKLLLLFPLFNAESTPTTSQPINNIVIEADVLLKGDSTNSEHIENNHADSAHSFKPDSNRQISDDSFEHLYVDTKPKPTLLKNANQSATASNSQAVKESHQNTSASTKKANSINDGVLETKSKDHINDLELDRRIQNLQYKFNTTKIEQANNKRDFVLHALGMAAITLLINAIPIGALIAGIYYRLTIVIIVGFAGLCFSIFVTVGLVRDNTDLQTEYEWLSRYRKEIIEIKKELDELNHREV